MMRAPAGIAALVLVAAPVSPNAAGARSDVADASPTALGECRPPTADSAANLLGVYIGVPGETLRNHNQYNSFTAAMGQAPRLVTTYVAWDRWGPAMVSQAQWGAGTMRSAPYSAKLIPVVGIPMTTRGDHSADQAFRDIADGKHDWDFAGILAAYAAVSKQLYIRPAWEMNGNWFPWSVTPSSVSEFVSAFQHVAALAHSFRDATVTVVWNPAAPGSGAIDYKSIYPGDNAVDVIGVDTFGVGAGGVPNHQVFETNDVMRFSAAAAAQMAVEHNKPLAFPEVGAGATDAVFPASLAQSVAASGARIAFVAIWDDPSGGNTNLYWSDTPATAVAWKRAFASIVNGCRAEVGGSR